MQKSVIKSKNMKYIKYLFVLLIALQSCSKEETKTETETTESSSQNQTKTEVILTIKTSEGKVKEGYLVMLFGKKFNPETSKPTEAIETVTSNAEGIAKFDMGKRVSSSKTYYFEVFTKKDDVYTLKSKYRTELEVKKGSSVKSEVLVY